MNWSVADYFKKQNEETDEKDGEEAGKTQRSDSDITDAGSVGRQRPTEPVKKNYFQPQ